MKPVNIILSTISLFFCLSIAHADSGPGGGFIPGAESTIAGTSIDGTLILRIDNGLYKQRGPITHSQRFDNRRYDNHYNRSRSVFGDQNREHYRNDYKRSYRNDHKRSFRNDYRRDFPRFRYNNKSNCRNIITIQKGYYGSRHVISTICDNNPRHKFHKTNPFNSRDRFRR